MYKREIRKHTRVAVVAAASKYLFNGNEFSESTCKNFTAHEFYADAVLLREILHKNCSYPGPSACLCVRAVYIYARTTTLQCRQRRVMAVFRVKCEIYETYIIVKGIVNARIYKNAFHLYRFAGKMESDILVGCVIVRRIY